MSPTSPTTKTDTILEVTDLRVEFLRGDAWEPVVTDVSFDLRRGETLALVGESGCGKSVTSLAVMGLLPAGVGRVAHGSAQLEDVDLLTLSRREFEDVRGSRIAMIFQEPMRALNPAFTVGEQVAEAVRRHERLPRRQARDRAVEMLDRVRIPHAARRARAYPHEFSGGMRQRVMIALALACSPNVLIADEPTTALDVTVQAQILDLLREIQETTSTAILIITHDLGVVADIADRVAVMYAGQIVETADVDAIYDEPRHPYTNGLLRSMPTSATEAGELWSIDGSPPEIGGFPAGCRFNPRCEHAIDSCRTGPSGAIPLPLDHAHPARCLRVDELSGLLGRRNWS